MYDKMKRLNMDKFLTTGLFLSVEERLILQISLPTLQSENRFSGGVSLLGKILGTNGDYYIAYGWRDSDWIRTKMFFYSLEGHFWRVLFPPSSEDMSEFRFLRSRFTGDPTHVTRFHLGDKKVTIREESRLSAVVHLLDWETAIGPKGALIVDAQGTVQKNHHFDRVSWDVFDLGSYVHHRLPKSPDSFVPRTRLCPASGDGAMEFLEPILSDYPPGCWILHREPLPLCTVRLNNLWWPGFNFCCLPDSGEYDSIYVGLGDRNDDLPFML